MIGSIFSEKLVYEKTGFRTPEYRGEVKCIALKNNELDEIKTGLNQEKLEQSRVVAPTGIELTVVNIWLLGIDLSYAPRAKGKRLQQTDRLS